MDRIDISGPGFRQLLQLALSPTSIAKTAGPGFYQVTGGQAIDISGPGFRQLLQLALSPTSIAKAIATWFYQVTGGQVSDSYYS